MALTHFLRRIFEVTRVLVLSVLFLADGAASQASDAAATPADDPLAPLDGPPAVEETVGPCAPARGVRLPAYFNVSERQLVNGLGHQMTPPALADASTILATYSKSGERLVHLLVNRCEEGTYILALEKVVGGDCQTWLYSYCKTEQGLRIHRKDPLGEIGRPEYDAFRYVEDADLDDTRFDYSLPVTDKAGNQYIILNGKRFAWKEDPILGILPARVRDAGNPIMMTLYLLVVTRSQIFIMKGEDPGQDSSWSMPLEKPAETASLSYQKGSFLLLLDDRAIVIEITENGYSPREARWQLPDFGKPRRSEISFNSRGVGIFVVHRSDCEPNQGEFVRFFAFRIDLENGEIQQIDDNKDFNIPLEDPSLKDCRIQLLPEFLGSRGEAFKLHAFYGNSDLKNWTYGLYKRGVSTHGRLEGKVEGRLPGSLTDAWVGQDKENIYVLYLLLDGSNRRDLKVIALDD